jgi:quercetin dioxygenase-like cupin family protein
LSSYPHTIDNGAGERLTFVAIRRDDRGEYIECRNSVDPGAGPPMHVHHLQEEALTVERGTIGYQSEGGPERTAGPGETVVFGPGQSHRFWNAGEDQLICSGYVRPPANFEYFLSEIYASMRRNGGNRPGFFDSAYLSRRYRSEFEITEVPKPIRRIGFPVIAAAGRLLGLNRRFADAPEPVAA